MHRHSTIISLACCVVIWLSPGRSEAANEVDQVINLSIGWNAIWLEVEPTYAAGDTFTLATGSTETLATGDVRIGMVKSPEDVFVDLDIIRVASPKTLSGLAEVFGDAPTSAGTFNQEGWRQWNRSGLLGDNLVSISGNRPYLIQVQDPAVSPTINLTVSGSVRFFSHTWNPDRYNLVGFGIDPASAPTFDEFFAPSAGRHPVDTTEHEVYKLDATSGNWQEVAGTDAMEDNRAYWVFCSGNSNYMGPVAITFDGQNTGRLNFAGDSDAVAVDALTLDLEGITFTNLLATGSAEPELDLIVGDNDLALHVVKPASDSLSYVLGNQVDSTPNTGSPSDLEESVTARTNGTLTLGAQRNWTTGAVGRTNLYRLRTGGGTQFWLPISANRNSLQLPTDLLPVDGSTGVAGLWVGEVVIDSVTSIVEDGSPVRPTSTRAPLRILLHSDADGKVKLLSQVTLMQTKSADAEVAPKPVLVIDQAKIPFFEGIKKRRGKRVGVRLDAVAFDMPRKLDPTSQSALVEDNPQLTFGTPSEFANYLNSLGLRPQSLVEDYELSWDLEGALGAGKTARTANDAPLNLDPFHRSNPFRHAFHQKHPRGPNITRAIEIVFDAEQPIGDRLHGSYTETVHGLASEALASSGEITLLRVSPVKALNQ